MRKLAVENQLEVEKALISTLKLALLGLSIVLFFATLDTVKQKKEHIAPLILTQIINKPYKAQFVSSPAQKETLVAVVTGKGINEKDTQQIAQTIRKKKRQNTTVYTYSDKAEIDSLEQYPEELKYKVETTEKGTEVVHYDFYPDIVADKEISRDWDLSKNKLDLVTGLLTVSISMDKKATKEAILAQAKGLSELLILHNPKAKIQQVILEVKAGSNSYHYDSKEAQMLANVYHDA